MGSPILTLTGEGGFAHVYVVRLEYSIHGTDTAVLKRVAVPDKENLNIMRIEVDTMVIAQFIF